MSLLRTSRPSKRTSGLASRSSCCCCPEGTSTYTRATASPRPRPRRETTSAPTSRANAASAMSTSSEPETTVQAYGAVLRPAATADELAATGLGGYLSWLAVRGYAFRSYHDLWAWSISDVEAFWSSIWEYFEVSGKRGQEVLPDKGMPGARWFPGSRVNYAEQIVGVSAEFPDRVAIRSHSQTRDSVDLTYAQLADQVQR